MEEGHVSDDAIDLLGAVDFTGVSDHPPPVAWSLSYAQISALPGAGAYFYQVSFPRLQLISTVSYGNSLRCSSFCRLRLTVIRGDRGVHVAGFFTACSVHDPRPQQRGCSHRDLPHLPVSSCDTWCGTEPRTHHESWAVSQGSGKLPKVDECRLCLPTWITLRDPEEQPALGVMPWGNGFSRLKHGRSSGEGLQGQEQSTPFRTVPPGSADPSPDILYAITPENYKQGMGEN